MANESASDADLQERRASALRAYIAALDAADYETIDAMFTTDGRVTSPFLGKMPAADFFDHLGRASANNTITPIDLFFPASGEDPAIAYFQYHWTMTDGSVVLFKAMDLFEFEAGSTQFTSLDIIYDTHPVRSEYGDKYQNLARQK